MRGPEGQHELTSSLGGLGVVLKSKFHRRQQQGQLASQAANATGSQPTSPNQCMSGLSSINRPGRGEGVVGYNGFWRSVFKTDSTMVFDSPLKFVMLTLLTRTPAHHSVTPSIRSYRGSSSL